MLTKKRRSVLMSVMTVMLCLTLIAGGTYALFSDQVTLTTHLKAGTLDITLERIKLVTKTIDNDSGYLKDNDPSFEKVDFSKPTNRNVFDIDSGHKIVPGCSYTATLQLTNKTDVAFAYWIEIINRDFNGLELADQLEVSVKLGEGNEASKILSQGLTVGSSSNPIGILTKTSSAVFDVSLVFADLANNNDAMNQSLNFDVVVHAVQVVDPPKN